MLRAQPWRGTDRMWAALTWPSLPFCSAGGGQCGTGAAFPELFPEATRFQAEAGPPLTAAYRGDLLGWAFSSSETVGSVGYSGRALDILVGLDARGRIAGARLLAEEADLRRRPDPGRARGLPRGYRGRPVKAAIEVRRGGGEGAVAAVSGVHLLARHPRRDSRARAVARAKGLLGRPGASTGRASSRSTGPRWWPTARSSCDG